MKMFQKKKKMLTQEQAEEIRIQEFFDRIVPSTVRFFTDHFICGNSCKCVWAVFLTDCFSHTGSSKS